MRYNGAVVLTRARRSAAALREQLSIVDENPIHETFPPCGVPQGKKGTIKPIKTGTFSTSEVEFR